MKTTVLRRATSPKVGSPPTVDITDDDLLRVIELAATRTVHYPLPRYPLLFSCSVNGVWARHGNRRDDRVYVDGESWLLDRVRVLAMDRRPSAWGDGGVVRIRLNGVDLHATGERILNFRRSSDSRVRS